jgi:hypothetical protein
MFGLGASDSLASEFGEAFFTTTALEPAPTIRRVMVEIDLVSYAVVGSRTSQPRASPESVVAWPHNGRTIASSNPRVSVALWTQPLITAAQAERVTIASRTSGIVSQAFSEDRVKRVVPTDRRANEDLR